MRLFVIFGFILFSSLSTSLIAQADTPEERIQSLIDELRQMPEDEQDADHVVGEEMC